MWIGGHQVDWLERLPGVWMTGLQMKGERWGYVETRMEAEGRLTICLRLAQEDGAGPRVVRGVVLHG